MWSFSKYGWLHSESLSSTYVYVSIADVALTLDETEWKRTRTLAPVTGRCWALTLGGLTYYLIRPSSTCVIFLMHTAKLPHSDKEMNSQHIGTSRCGWSNWGVIIFEGQVPMGIHREWKIRQISLIFQLSSLWSVKRDEWSLNRGSDVEC